MMEVTLLSAQNACFLVNEFVVELCSVPHFWVGDKLSIVSWFFFFFLFSETTLKINVVYELSFCEILTVK